MFSLDASISRSVDVRGQEDEESKDEDVDFEEDDEYDDDDENDDDDEEEWDEDEEEFDEEEEPSRHGRRRAEWNRVGRKRWSGCSFREGAIRLAPHCYNTLQELEKVAVRGRLESIPQRSTLRLPSFVRASSSGG